MMMMKLKCHKTRCWILVKNQLFRNNLSNIYFPFDKNKNITLSM